MARTLAFHIYKSQVGAMSGKPTFKSIKKPSDLMKLPQDVLRKKVRREKGKAVYDPDRAIDAYNKTIKDKNKWLRKN